MLTERPLRGDIDALHLDMAAAEVPRPSLRDGIGTVEMHLDKCPEPGVIIRREDRALRRVLEELDCNWPEGTVDDGEESNGSGEATLSLLVHWTLVQERKVAVKQSIGFGHRVQRLRGGEQTLDKFVGDWELGDRARIGADHERVATVQTAVSKEVVITPPRISSRDPTLEPIEG
jgi:hypothetical protein